MDRVDRRTFLKRAAAVSAATAATALVPEDISASALAAPGRQSAVRWQKAPCALCGVGCGLLIGTSEGRAVAIRGDPDSPVSRGLACVKGYHAAEGLYGAGRITRAMVRRNGQLVPVPLSAALDLVARTIQDTIRRHGKESVALYGSAQWSIPDAYIAAKLVKAGLGTNNIETSARIHAGSVRAGQQRSFGLDGNLGCYEDIDHADTFVLWGVNLAESHPVLFSRLLERRRRHPAARIIDLSPRTTRTSYVCDQSLLFAPHAAAAVANGICRELVERKLVRRDFVDRYLSFKLGRLTEPSEPGGGAGPETVTDASWTEYVSFLSEYDSRRVEQLSGLSAASTRWLASVYGDPARKVMSIWDRNLNAGGEGAGVNTLLYNIHLLTGKIASPGNGALALTGQPSGGYAAPDAGASAGSLPRGAVSSETDRGRAAGIWGIPPERLHATPGPHAVDLFRALDRGEIHLLWIQATNPMLSLPNAGRYRQAAERPDRFIVVSEAYPTATTEVADVVLPAALWLEREGVFAGAGREMQHFGRMVNPPGEATPDAWLMIEVARRLGLEGLFPYDRDRYVDQVWEEYRRFYADSTTPLPGLELLRSQPGVHWPLVNGREVQWRYHTALDPAADPARGDYDFHGHPDHRAWIWLSPHQPSGELPEREYPFRLITGAVLEHWGGGAITRRIPTLHQALPQGYVELNRDDARELGVRNRQMVRLVSRRGTLEIQARIEYRSQPPRGLVFVPAFDEDHPVNRLTLDQVDPLSGEPVGVCAVRVEPLGPAGR
ncbi:MAG TPA: molybdopterin-dependent oxidoreductase [Gemmatimonadales bacterium]|nr:molybdopterin-dependent oxidoreductase [Gemmatimonadales bacterium]